MSFLFLNLDLSELDDLAGLEGAAKSETERAARELTAATNARAVELAQERLHSRRNMFKENLSVFQVDDHTWCVNLNADARWINDGMPAHNMLADLLKSDSAKTAKDGHKYVVVPFQHNKTKQDSTPAQQNLLATIAKEMANIPTEDGSKITPSKLEYNKDGDPKLGLVRSMDIMTKPTKRNNSPGQGAGPAGSVMQGPTGVPLLQGVRVYQKKIKDKQGHEGVGRFVMTFRIASSKHEAQGRWNYPGTPPTHIMEDALQWALDTWSTKVAPAIMARIVSSIS